MEPFPRTQQPADVQQPADAQPPADAQQVGGQQATQRSGQFSSATALDRALDLARVDLPADRPLPVPPRWILASIVAIAGSLAADAVIVAIGTALFPATKHFVHFQFFDYARLTVVGVVVACLAWPVVTAISSSARWLFFRLAILVTLFLLLPDLWIYLKGEPAKAVAVLVVMHLAIALVTYNALVRIAPPRRGPSPLAGRGTLLGGAQRSGRER